MAKETSDAEGRPPRGKRSRGTHHGLAWTDLLRLPDNARPDAGESVPAR